MGGSFDAEERTIHILLGCTACLEGRADHYPDEYAGHSLCLGCGISVGHTAMVACPICDSDRFSALEDPE